jgi:hypothetical protein
MLLEKVRQNPCNQGLEGLIETLISRVKLCMPHDEPPDIADA